MKMTHPVYKPGINPSTTSSHLFICLFHLGVLLSNLPELLLFFCDFILTLIKRVGVRDLKDLQHTDTFILLLTFFWWGVVFLFSSLIKIRTEADMNIENEYLISRVLVKYQVLNINDYMER